YFILIKGAKGAAFMTPETKDFILNNGLKIIGISLVFWTVLLQVLHSLLKVDILKVVILIGTFALAMAFASNDLVNFIGVPLAGLASYKAFLAAPGTDATEVLMVALQGEVETKTIFLVAAGVIMVITLWISRKARSVVNTSLDLSRQDEGTERFGSSGFSRVLVRRSIGLSNTLNKFIPDNTRSFISKQFDATAANKQNAKSGVSFDKLRAAVNLVVAAILISFATSLKLPLSTTYVTFMVAMGTSLADRAWGRESAVYRITGVLSVIGGWFLTAISAFTVAFVVVNFISWGGIYAIGAMVLFALFMIIRTHKFHSTREKDDAKIRKIYTEEIDDQRIIKSCSDRTKNIVSVINDNYAEIINALYYEDRKQARHAVKAVRALNKDLKEEQNNLGITISKLKEEGAETSHYYVQMISYLREIGHCLNYIAEPSFEHIDNMHKGLTPQQKEDIDTVQSHLFNMLNLAQEIIDETAFSRLDELISMEQELLEIIKKMRKKQIKRIKQKETGKKNSMLFLNILQETKNLSLFSVNLLKAHRNFIMYNDSDYY
ncbi:MAG: phosphate permease, partial [Bacteroidota bacterium]